MSVAVCWFGKWDVRKERAKKKDREAEDVKMTAEQPAAFIDNHCDKFCLPLPVHEKYVLNADVVALSV